MIRFTFLCLLLLAGVSCAWAQSPAVVIEMGHWTVADLDSLLESQGVFTEPGEQVAAISKAFVGTPYLAHSLIGAADQREKLVVRFDGFDCMTLIESVEALRLARAFRDVEARLAQVRYRKGAVAYLSRNHFFSDWISSNSDHVDDVTARLAGDHLICSDKVLNRKSDGSLFLQGYPSVPRSICYLPSDIIGAGIFAGLKTGDYVGFYSDSAGLDVTHSGIVVKQKGRVLLRHASSVVDVHKVVDVDLEPYLKKHTGIIILRPLSQ